MSGGWYLGGERGWHHFVNFVVLCSIYQVPGIVLCCDVVWFGAV